MPAPRTNHLPASADTVIVGAGQAGLATAYHLMCLRQAAIVLEANERVGDGWRDRWDSLRLFSPARYDGLPGMPFPAPGHYYPTKDEMGDYLEAYAQRFDLPVHTGVRVERVTPSAEGFTVDTNLGRIDARQVVVAMANLQRPYVPDFAEELDPAIRQMHSKAYRNPAQLKGGDVLVVGAGNSGAEVALDVVTGHRTWLSGRFPGQVPFDIDTPAARKILVPFVLRFLFHRVLTVHTPIGRKLRPKLVSHGGPLVRTKAHDLDRAGIERVPRTVGVRDGKPVLEDGRVLDVTNVVWCTGFGSSFTWLDADLGDERQLTHQSGAEASVPGLYFVGLEFLYALSSVMVHGAARDAGRVARAIRARSMRQQKRGAEPVPAASYRPG